ncbi:MAG: TonB-dependent receptor [Gammaproteobacteria bacterium]|nr:TonB-dependent receptor [Gammaproteobacteria bacterium]
MTSGALAQDAGLGTISITATREERATAEVPQAIAVVGKEELDEKKMFNVKEALQGIPGVLTDSKNGGSDARLIIRGAGLKARYGIREIMVLRDGVPLTDPDSFTKLDFVDTQDIERIEVAKGPGNLFATGSAGGAIQIISRSVFDDSANQIRVGIGNYGTQNYHLRQGVVGETQALALTATHRTQDNDWRHWNEFDTSQVGLKHGLLLSNGDTLESEISYSESNIQLPGGMDEALFQQFKDSGKQTDTSEFWKHQGRYSKTWFFNTRYEMERGNVSFKPRFYYNTWYHYHPVVGIINETEDWVYNVGTDLEAHLRHGSGTLVGGVTVRQEEVPDSRKYLHRDLQTSFSPWPPPGTTTIEQTLSDAKGELAAISSSTSLLTGLYVQESWRPSERWIVDLGARYDVVSIDQKTDELNKFDWATKSYKAGDGLRESDKTYYLPAPKLAVSYRVNEYLNLFGTVAQAGQIPSTSEISSNPDLKAATSRNYELGIKGRSDRWQFDASVYVNPVEDEIVSVRSGPYTTEYENAGKTDKRGVEFSGSVEVSEGWQVGGYYAYSDYTFDSFTESVRDKGVVYGIDRSGNHLPFIPEHQYGVFIAWKSPSGWRARVTSNTWGEYWIDNANSEKYEGWDWITNVSLGYERGQHAVTLNVDNVFDELYAIEVSKEATLDNSGDRNHTAASPRTAVLTYRYNF